MSVAASFGGGSPANAQAQPTQVPQGTPADPAAKSPDGKSQDIPLSDKLNDSKGVLKPPTGVDPKINKGAPPTTGDRMPVIVPPGDPGSDQSVQPK